MKTMLRSIILALVLLSLNFAPASAATSTDVQVLVYRNLDANPIFSYLTDSCAANIDVTILWKPDNAQYTLFVPRTTPNVNYVVGNISAYTICATPVASFSGPGTLTVVDSHVGVTTRTYGPVHYDNFGKVAVIRLRITAESGE